MPQVILDIDGIDGECTTKGYVGKIVCNSMSFSSAQEVDKSKNATRTVTAVTIEQISIERPFDSSSAKIMKRCWTGKSVGTVKIYLLKAAADEGDSQVKFMQYDLTNTLIVSHEVSYGETDMTETIKLDFTKIAFSYMPQKADGTLGGAVPGSFDLALGRAEDS